MSKRNYKPMESQAVELPDVPVSLPPLDESMDSMARPDKEIELIEGPGAMKKADELAFMEEKIVIVISESTDANAEDPVPLGINGRMKFVFRGQPTIIQRKYVERLAKAKTTSYKQDLNKTDPVEFNKLVSRRAHQYPFAVIRDDNPDGAAWLAKVLAE